MFKKPGEKKDESLQNETPKSKTVPIDNISDEPEHMQMDFVDEDEANAHAAKQTKTSKDNDVEIDPNTPIDKIKADVAEYEQSKSGTLEYKDLLQMATFIITMVDTGLSTLFNLLAGGKHASDYAMPEPNKKLLSQQLALILGKYQSKFKIEFTFFAGIVLLYMPMGVAVFRARKEKKQLAKQAANEKIKNAIKEKEPTDMHYRHVENIEPPIVEKQEPIIEKIEIPGAKPEKNKGKGGRRPKAY